MSLRTAVAHRNLLYLLSMRELRTRYKRSLLGWAWSLLNPLIQMAIFTVIFLKIFKQPAPLGEPSGLQNFPLFFLCAFIPFNFFSVTVGVALNQVQANSALVKKVVFPHEHLVLSVVFAQFVTLLIEWSVLLIAFAWAGNILLQWVPMLLVVLVLLAVFTTGVALLLASLNVFFTDVGYLWMMVAQVLFYATPVIWNPATVGVPALTYAASYNPTGAFVMAIRELAYNEQMPSATRLVQLTLYAAAAFMIGAAVFSRLSPRFAEEL